MKKTLVLCLLLWLSWNTFSQDTLRVYTWEEALKAPRDSVYRLDASKHKWDSLPAELFTFTKLHSLNISRNNLRELPMEIGVFKQLKVIDASRNKLETFPVALCQMTHLRKLLISRNLIPSIPSCIGYFSQLTVLDIWDNPMKGLPEELMKLDALRTVDMRGILCNAAFQEKWMKAMPDVKWYFDAPCHCLD
jgi:Leucine-rich repeat (LRR) protein